MLREQHFVYFRFFVHKRADANLIANLPQRAAESIRHVSRPCRDLLGFPLKTNLLRRRAIGFEAEEFDCPLKINAFNLFDESNDIPSNSAGPAKKKALLQIDREGGMLVLVEGTDTPKLETSFREANVLADHIDDR